MFFTPISQMMTEGVDLTLVMRKAADGQMTVSLMPRSQSLKEGAQNRFVPLMLSGTPAELDAGFFAAAMQPVQRVTGLIANLAEFEKQAGKAVADSKASKSAKTPKEKESKEAKDKRERYEKYMKKAEEQMAAQHYDEAILSFQQARLLATEEQAPKLDEKIAEVRAAQSQGSLFEVPAVQPATPVPTAAPVQVALPAPQPVAQAHPMPAAAPIPQQVPVQTIPPQPTTVAMPKQTAPQPAAAPYPAGGYPQQPLPPMPQYGSQYAGVDPLGMPLYDNPDNPPTYRPEEYAGIVDFPQGMITQAPGTAANTGTM